MGGKKKTKQNDLFRSAPQPAKSTQAGTGFFTRAPLTPCTVSAPVGTQRVHINEEMKDLDGISKAYPLCTVSHAAQLSLEFALPV